MPRGTVEIIDAGGWRKTYPLDKNIIHIGSDARNDIAIENFHGAGLAARHVQLITSPTGAQGYRLINIGPLELRSGEDAARLIAPRSAIDLADGEVIKLGDLTFIFWRDRSAEAAPRENGQSIPAPRLAPAPIGAAPPVAPPDLRPRNYDKIAVSPPAPDMRPTAASAAISAMLNLPQTQLAPDQVIDGSITLKNLGDKPGVQFKLEIAGLDVHCYEIGPGPILFPNAEKQVLFRVRHPMRPTPPAGEQRFTLSVTAPGAYPGEAATVNGSITLLPFFKHELKLSFTE
jgi:hypothetical protein